MASPSKPLPEPPATPFGPVCNLCGEPRASQWKAGAHFWACARCDRVDRWPR